MTLKYFSKKTGKEFHGFYSALWIVRSIAKFGEITISEKMNIWNGYKMEYTYKDICRKMYIKMKTMFYIFIIMETVIILLETASALLQRNFVIISLPHMENVIIMEIFCPPS